jgi:hypothetical protein
MRPSRQAADHDVDQGDDEELPGEPLQLVLPESRYVKRAKKMIPIRIASS